MRVYYIAHADKTFGIPEQKKFPLDTKDHVISAIRFFNYADPQYERALASRIISKIKQYGITELTPSKENRFYNYYHPESDYVAHHGVLGMKWGVRRYQNKDGSYTPEGKRLLAQHNKNAGSFAYRVGEKRLINRSRAFEKKSAKYASSFSRKKQELGRSYESAGEKTADILKRPDDVRSVGKRTIAGRVGLGIGAGATGAATVALMGAVGPLALVPATPAAIAFTKKFVESRS